jgi:hypothetical protein
MISVFILGEIYACKVDSLTACQIEESHLTKQTDRSFTS